MPRDNGGLGLKDARKLNRALMSKLAWGKVNDEEILWLRVMLAKYNIRNTIHYGSLLQLNGSHVWMNIGSLCDDLKHEIRWSAKDGSSIRLWIDLWASEDNLC